jgi:hypothetical protein
VCSSAQKRPFAIAACDHEPYRGPAANERAAKSLVKALDTREVLLVTAQIAMLQALGTTGYHRGACAVHFPFCAVHACAVRALHAALYTLQAADSGKAWSAASSAGCGLLCFEKQMLWFLTWLLFLGCRLCCRFRALCRLLLDPGRMSLLCSLPPAGGQTWWLLPHWCCHTG